MKSWLDFVKKNCKSNSRTVYLLCASSLFSPNCIESFNTTTCMGQKKIDFLCSFEIWNWDFLKKTCRVIRVNNWFASRRLKAAIMDVAEGILIRLWMKLLSSLNGRPLATLRPIERRVEQRFMIAFQLPLDELLSDWFYSLNVSPKNLFVLSSKKSLGSLGYYLHSHAGIFQDELRF